MMLETENNKSNMEFDPSDYLKYLRIQYRLSRVCRRAIAIDFGKEYATGGLTYTPNTEDDYYLTDQESQDLKERDEL